MDWARAVSINTALGRLTPVLRTYRTSLLGVSMCCVSLWEYTSPHLTSPHLTSPHLTSTAEAARHLDAVQRAMDDEVHKFDSVFRTEECFVCKHVDPANKRCSGCRQVTCMSLALCMYVAM